MSVIQVRHLCFTGLDLMPMAKRGWLLSLPLAQDLVVKSVCDPQRAMPAEGTWIPRVF